MRGSVYDLWVVKQSWQLEKPQSATEYPSEAGREAGRVAASKAQRVSAFLSSYIVFNKNLGDFVRTMACHMSKKSPRCALWVVQRVLRSRNL